jgi:hypothetical protein
VARRAGGVWQALKPSYHLDRRPTTDGFVAVYWRKINLCEVAKVTLECDGKKCWANLE